MKKTRIAILALITIFACSSFAKSEIGFNAVGGRIGFIMPEDPIDNTFGFGLNADLGTLMPNLTLHAYLDYWSKGYDVTYYEWSWSVIGLGAIAKYEFAMEGNIKPYAGGGLGFNIGKWSSKYTGPTSPFLTDVEASESETDIGIHLLGGAKMPLSPKMDGFAELKYTIDGADYLGIYVGVSYKLK